MWRSLKQAAVKSKIHNKGIRHYSSEKPSTSGKVAFVIAATGAGLASAVVYSKYDSKLKSVLERNIPHIDEIYKLLPDISKSKSLTPNVSADDKKESTMSTNSLVKEPNYAKPSSESQKFGVESKVRESSFIKGSNLKTVTNNVDKLGSESAEQIIALSERQVSEPAFSENFLIDTVKELESSLVETKSAYEDAATAIRKHIKTLCVALSLPGGSDNNIVWKQADQASSDRYTAIKIAHEKASSTKALVEKLDIIARNVALEDPKHPFIKMCEDTVEKITKELDNSKAEIKSVENEAKTASEYQNLVKKSKIEFQQKLEIMLPNYVHGLNHKKTITESDLNALIANAHQKIDQLQKQLAKQQVTEEIRINEALRKEKLKDHSIIEAKIEAELEKRNIEVELAFARKVVSLKESFESELGKLLHCQAAAHLDHIKEVLRIHEQELEQRYSLDLEEKLLYVKGIFISEVSASMARLKEILVFLKAKTEFDVESRKAQSLWLSCHSLSEKISLDAGHMSPLGEDIALIKLATDESNVFVNIVLAGIPSEAVTRGVYSPDVLKQKFFGVKKACRKVAMIDESNDSLYCYLLSYLQSYLIIDEVSIPKAELDGKVAVDPSEWDAYDILSRISYSLKTDDLEQALRYANQLKGEAKTVAKDWVKELRLFLETQIALKALSTHAVAISVQAYH